MFRYNKLCSAISRCCKHLSVSSILESNGELLKPARLILISDTHSSHEGLGVLPGGDILIHAGDFTESRPPKPAEYKHFIDWFSSQPHRHKVLISGNRDQFMDTITSRKVMPGITNHQRIHHLVP